LTKFYEENYKSATGNYDIYVLFLEKAFNLINENGMSSYIMPHKFLIADFGIGIRTFLKEKTAIETLVHFGSEMVFADASTYTCIINLTRLDKDKIKFKKIIPKKRQPYIIGDVFSSIFQGIATSLDAVYVFKGFQNGNIVKGYNEKFDYHFDIEMEIAKPFIKGNQLSRNADLRASYFIIFPYLVDNNGAKPMTENYISQNLPKAYNYLKHFEQEIKGRERNRMNIDEGWFLYIYPKNLNKFHHPKIMTQEISLGCNMTYDNDGRFYHPTTIYSFVKNEKFVVDEKFYLAIMNSQLMWFFLKNTGTELRGGYFRFKPKEKSLFKTSYW